MYFVKLTTIGGNCCYINLDRVNDILEDTNCTHISYGGEGCTTVKESLDEIYEMIPALGKR